CRRVVVQRLGLAADEYCLMTDRPFPAAETYAGFDMHEDGIGMARTFAMEFRGEVDRPIGPQSGFFAWVDGAPAAGYRAPRNPAGDTGLHACASGGSGNVVLRARTSAPVGVITGEFGAKVLQPLIADLRRDDVRLITVRNEFFGGNTAVT